MLSIEFLQLRPVEVSSVFALHHAGATEQSARWLSATGLALMTTGENFLNTHRKEVLDELCQRGWCKCRYSQSVGGKKTLVYQLSADAFVCLNEVREYVLVNHRKRSVAPSTPVSEIEF